MSARPGSACRLPRCRLAGGRASPAGDGVGGHGGTAALWPRHRRRAHGQSPPHRNGLRIAHRSALHRGDCMPRAAIRRAIALAHTAPPDLVVVSGEVITSARDPLEDWVVALSRLRVPWGLWGAATATTSGGSGGRHGRRHSLRATACPGGGSRVRPGPGAAAPSLGSGSTTNAPAWANRPPGGAASRRGSGGTAPTSGARSTPRPSPRLQRWASSSASWAILMAVSYASHSGTVNAARPASSRRSWRACTACREALGGTPQAMRPLHALENLPSCT